MNFTTLLFDLDGTLVNSLPGIESSSRLAVQALFPGQWLPDWRKLIGPPIREMFRSAFPHLPPDGLEGLVQLFRRHYDREDWRKSLAYAGVEETLKELCARGIRCFVVTNKPSRPTVQILEYLGIAGYFQGVICPDFRVPPFDSKGTMVGHILKNYCLDPVRTLMVGDSLDDALAAQENGVGFAGVTYGYGKVEANASCSKDYLLQSFPDLIRMV